MDEAERYRRTEGLLYGLRRPPEAAYARPARPPAPRTQAGPRGPVRESARRIDLGIAVARAGLTPEERAAISDHYVDGTRRRYQDRAPAVRKIAGYLEMAASLDFEEA